MNPILCKLLSSPLLMEPRRAVAQLAALAQRGPARPSASLSLNPAAPSGERVIPGLGVGIVEISGVIARHAGGSWGGVTDTAELERELADLAARPDVHTIILGINSPGGQASGTFEVAELIAEIAQEKRVIAWIDDTGASAAYLLASGAGEIYAIPSAAVGSIGCVLQIEDASQMFARLGLKIESFASAPGKLRAADGSPLSDDDRAFFQGRVDELGARFRDFVAARRPGVSAGVLASGDYGSAGTYGIENGLIDGVFPSLRRMAERVLSGAD